MIERLGTDFIDLLLIKGTIPRVIKTTPIKVIQQFFNYTVVNKERVFSGVLKYLENIFLQESI